MVNPLKEGIVLDLIQAKYSIGSFVWIIAIIVFIALISAIIGFFNRKE
ncbi:MAG: hypothetical protein ACP5OG_04315 [Candidatus Nanoarchaeia archaeon]